MESWTWLYTTCPISLLLSTIIKYYTNRYLLRTKKATIHELDSLLTLSKSFHFPNWIIIHSDIPNANLLAQLRSFNVHSTNWIQRFHSFTRHSPCLPMKVFSHFSIHSPLDRFSTFHSAFWGRIHVFVASPRGTCVLLCWERKWCIGIHTEQTW